MSAAVETQNEAEPHSPRMGLRNRVIMVFVIGALLLSLLLAGVAFTLTRSNLLNVRESTGIGLAGRNAVLVGQQLNVEQANAEEILLDLSTPIGSIALLKVNGEWLLKDAPSFADTDIDAKLLATLDQGTPHQMRYKVGAIPYLVVGFPLPDADAVYIEAVPLDDIEETLNSLGIALFGGAAITVLAAAALGVWAASRVLSPLDEIGMAAAAIADGDLNTRLIDEGDRDLHRLTTSFNFMATSLQERIERDARFASEVSHELRSPLMTLSASVEVLSNQRANMPERAQTALELLETDLDRFEQLVEDLLEISRFDVGIVALQPSRFEVVEFVRQAIRLTGTETPITYDDDVDGTIIEADKRRLARVIANLVDNAAKYAGGASVLHIAVHDDEIEFAIIDDGPGVPESERLAIFDRFSRGLEGGRRGAGTGVGLGLALVAEHINLHRGSVYVTDRVDGQSGSRFVVTIPGAIK